MTNTASTFINKLRETIAEAPGRTVTLHTLIHAMGRGSFGVLLLLISLPCLLPLPGVVSLFGMVMILLGVQMLLGYPEPKLPERISHTRLSKKHLLRLVAVVQRPLQTIQPYIHRRLPGMVRRYGERFAGVMLIIQGLFIMIPVPFTNEPPALATTILALAFIQQDGLLAALSHIIGILGMLLILVVFHTVFATMFMAITAWL